MSRLALLTLPLAGVAFSPQITADSRGCKSLRARSLAAVASIWKRLNAPNQIVALTSDGFAAAAFRGQRENPDSNLLDRMTGCTEWHCVQGAA